MTVQAIPDNPANVVRSWLLDQWKGDLRPIEVTVASSEDADGRDAWYFLVTLPEPTSDTWDPVALADLERGLRDKALEVGLPYPWYVLPRAELDEVPEDNEDLPDETS